MTVDDPRIFRTLFSNVRLSWVWLIARVYLGSVWLAAGWHRLHDSVWLDGEATLRGYENQPADAIHIPVLQDGQAALLQFLVDRDWYGWVATIIAAGQTLAGIALILGFLTGAAAAGGLLGSRFTLAGAFGLTPLVDILAVLLMLAWKTAGWIGFDRWLLPLLGAPWQGGRLVQRRSLPHGVHASPPTS